MRISALKTILILTVWVIPAAGHALEPAPMAPMTIPVNYWPSIPGMGTRYLRPRLKRLKTCPLSNA